MNAVDIIVVIVVILLVVSVLSLRLIAPKLIQRRIKRKGRDKNSACSKCK